MEIQGTKCKCGCSKFYGQSQGPHIGLYCVACGNWIKWANKQEKRIVERENDARTA